MSTPKQIVYAGLLTGLVTTQAYAAETYRVSVGLNGSNGVASSPSINGDGRFVAFSSTASNLVPNDGNRVSDIFVHDRMDGSIERVSVDSGGTGGNAGSSSATISGDGRFVVFQSGASNLVPDDGNRVLDIFVHDRMDGSTKRVSINQDGVGGDNHSYFPSISGDGRFVTFHSEASNLVRNDENRVEDVFVHDRIDGSIKRVSINQDGMEGDNHSSFPWISGDGRFVAFQSAASNLVSDDDNKLLDVFVHDRMDGSIKRVSVNSDRTEGNSDSSLASISSDGRFVTFHSHAFNLVSNDENRVSDIFVHDRADGSIERVSVNFGGTEGNGNSFIPSISGDGRFVAFYSSASNLVPNDGNGQWDIFVHDRMDRSIKRVSVNFGGTGGNGNSFFLSISGDGRFVAFDSSASNLVPNDGNGQRDIFVRDQGALCDVKDPANQITLVHNQWAQLAVPCLPPDGASVGEVFGSQIVNPDHYSVFFYNGENYTSADADSPLTLGQGMWVIQTTGRDLTVELPPGSRSGSSNFNTGACTDESIGCQSIPVNTPQWLMVGVPFSLNGGIPLDDVLVTTTDATCPDEGCTVAWNKAAVGAIKINLIRENGTSTLRINNGINEIYFSDTLLESGFIADARTRVTGVTFDNNRCYFKEADIRFRRSTDWDDNEWGGLIGDRSFGLVAVHEFGHILGQKHDNLVQRSMNSSYPNGGTIGLAYEKAPFGKDRGVLRSTYGTVDSFRDVAASNWRRNPNSYPTASNPIPTERPSIATSIKLINSDELETVSVVAGNVVKFPYSVHNFSTINENIIVNFWMGKNFTVADSEDYYLGYTELTMGPGTDLLGEKSVTIPQSASGNYYFGYNVAIPVGSGNEDSYVNNKVRLYDVVSISTQNASGTGGSASGHYYCSSADSDSDGDGWGWENNASCIVGDDNSSGGADGCDYSQASANNGWGWNPSTQESCPPI